MFTWLLLNWNIENIPNNTGICACKCALCLQKNTSVVLNVGVVVSCRDFTLETKVLPHLTKLLTDGAILLKSAYLVVSRFWDGMFRLQHLSKSQWVWCYQSRHEALLGRPIWTGLLSEDHSADSLQRTSSWYTRNDCCSAVSVKCEDRCKSLTFDLILK